jgi:hypothetical protein
MKCERAGELLPDYLEGTLKQQDAQLLEEHLETCTACEKEVALARDLAVLPIDEPSPALRARFEAVLDAYEEGRNEGSRVALEKDRRPRRGWDWLRSPAWAMAGTAVLLAAGFFGGRYVSNINDAHSQAQLASVETELTNMRQLMVISLLQEESASERLQGVSMSTREEKGDPQILSALLHTLRYDSSVDVRLAALDALSRNGSRPQVRQGLVEALATQQSPLVQVQLIDLLVQLHDRSVVDQLQKIEQDAHTDPAVRQRAQRAIDQLS